MISFRAAQSGPSVFAFVVVCSILASAQRAYADQATVGRVAGSVEVLSDPADKPTGEGPFISFEGKYYRSRAAKVGTKLNESFVVKTGADSKLLLFYPNGDMVTIGANTFSRLRTHKGEKPLIRLIQGAVRAQILKGSTNSDLEVSTTTASMGVRGTDFFVKRPGVQSDSELVVLRGEVAVTAEGSKAPPIAVKAGERATTVAPGATATASKPVSVIPVDRSTLVAVQKETAVAPASKGLEDLEAKAAANVLADIKRTDPELYKKIEAKGDIAKTSYALNTLTVAQAFEEAPASAAPKDMENATTEPVSSDPGAIFALSPPCEPPVLVTPDSSTVFGIDDIGKPVTFSWRASGDKCTFEWQIANSETFQTTLSTQTTAETQTQWTAASGIYSWRVRAINADGRLGLWSASIRVSIPEVPRAVGTPQRPPEEKAPEPVAPAPKPEEPKPEEPKPEEPKPEDVAPPSQRRLLVSIGMGPTSYDHEEVADGLDYRSSGGGMRVQAEIEYRPTASFSVQAQVAHLSYDSFDRGQETEGNLLALAGRYLHQVLPLIDVGAGLEYRKETVLHHSFDNRVKSDGADFLYPVLSLQSHAWPKTMARLDLRYGILAGSESFDVRKDSETSIGASYERQWFSFPLSLGLRAEVTTWKMDFREDGGVGDGHLKFRRRDVYVVAGWAF